MLKVDQSKILYERACQSLATGVSTSFRTHVTSPPMYVERAEGPYFYDADGNELLDYGLAWGPLIVGNNHPTLTRAVTDQLARGYTYGTQHRGEIELAERMISVIPSHYVDLFKLEGPAAVLDEPSPHAR